MSEKTRKQDRRTRYTRQTIKDTFLELLKQKSFTKITVTEICKNAEINRGTFYLHYYDIHDVLSDIFNDYDSGYVNNGRSFILSKSKKLFLSVLSENTDGITIQSTVSG